MAAEPPWFRLQLTAEAWGSGLSGNLHTPRRGWPGTTSPHRPTTSEVGLDRYHLLPLLDLGLTLFGDHELHLTYSFLDVQGHATLRRSLISQAVHFPAGAAVRSGLSMQMLRATYRARWLTLDLYGWRFTPEVGVALNTFHYTLSSPQADGKTDRAYSFFSPYVGALIERPLIDDLLGLELQLGGAAFVNGTTILEGELRLVYTPFHVDRAEIGFVLGLRGAWIRRKDGQPLEQNDPNLRFGAFSNEPVGGLTLGVRIGF